MEGRSVVARKDETHDVEPIALRRGERDGGDELVGVRFERDRFEGDDLFFD